MLLLFYCKERRNLMQEEVEQKTMALSVRTARLTAELLQSDATLKVATER